MVENGKSLWLSVSVPIVSFAIPQAREFVESYPFPPPATVYGMLLSYVGETNRYRYRGVRLGILVDRLPASSLILRKVRRVKNKDLNHNTNLKPDFQMLLTGLNFLVHVSEPMLMNESLIDRIVHAFKNPDRIDRFGGISCGESHHLVDDIRIIPEEEVYRNISEETWVLSPSAEGDWACPVWVDHVGSEKTVWEKATFRPVPQHFSVAGIGDFLIRSISS